MLRSLFLAVLITAVSASAQLSTQTSIANGATTVTFSIRAGGANYAFSGVPYMAKHTFSPVQSTSAGMHFAPQPIVTSIWQDGAGRRRSERTYGASSGTTGTVAQILDPVEGVIYVLDAAAGVAHRIVAPAKVTHVNPGQIPGTRQPYTTTRPDGSVFSIEPLGTQVIAGFTTTGTRTTTHYPVGTSRGNDQPFDSVNDMWYAQQLGTSILVKSTDPRYGDTTTTLEGIVPGEQDASLFRPPAGYRVVDESGPFAVKLP